MAHAVRTLLAAGAGPRRMRGELRRRTARLHAVRSGPAAVGSVGAQLPASLLDGGLAPLLSERLRTLLLPAPDESPPDGAAPPSHRAAPAAGGAAVAAGRAAAARAPAPGAAARRGVADSAAASALRQHRFEPVPSRDGRNGLRAAPEITSPPHGAGRAPVADGVAAAGHPPQERAAPLPRVRQPSAGQSESLLASRLREYWRLHVARPAAPVAVPVPTAAPPAAGAVIAPVAAPPPSRSGANWPERVGREAARRVFGPAGTALSTAPPVLADSGATAPLAQPVQIRNEFHVTVGAHEDDDALADRIADLLREQALQHGIDLT